MDEREIAETLAPQLGISPRNLGVQRCWNLLLLAKLGGPFTPEERTKIHEELMEIERRTHAGFGMVRFL